MSSDQFVKDPGETKAYSIDHSNELLSGDTISTSTWSIPAGITEVSETETATVATIEISGGTVGTTYRCENTVVTVGAETLVESILIYVTDK